ncbi:hypothetical protein [Qipengyuania sp.]|uniref:hypothetical protein n=1 Tax=Qipengyuania sp. TaxID=2004515 RepID=UPI0035C7BD95
MSSMKILAALTVAAALSMPAASAGQSGTDPIIAEGACDPDSGVTIDGEKNDFACDVAVIMRAQLGTVLIQFTDKAGDDGRIVGFGGVIEGKQGFGADATQMMAVQRIYLAGGAQPVPADRGTCIMNWTGLHRTGGRLKSVLCGGAGEADGYDIKAMVILETEAGE